ncbi:helix-turn-helix transcriptional regulator, partial [Patescibacteria group bacterium]|nr:helix-turn-helix transcriptional regulator [Patescibacteria group bacterium]
RDNHAEQNTNFLPPLVYTFELSINLNDFNPSYPKNPHTLGERIRKARMDKGLYAKELAKMLGVTDDTMLNWEKGRNMPQYKDVRNLQNALDLKIPAVLIYRDYPFNPVTFSQKFKQKRLDLHLNQKEAAKKLGFEVTTIRRLECGKMKKPQKKTMEKLKDFLMS